MKISLNHRIKAGILSIVVLLGVFTPIALMKPSQVSAVSAGNTYIRCDRMMAATNPGNCLVVFTTSSTTATETTIKVTLGSQWVSGVNFSATATNYTVTTTGIPSATTAMPGISTADNVTGNTIRFPVTNLTNSTTYAFIITNGGTGLIVNPAASNTIVDTVFTRTGADAATADTKDIAVPVITNDQIVITATVPPSFTFVFNNNSQAIGTLSTGSVSAGSGTTITVTSNSAGGWNAYVKQAGAGLVSANASKTILDTGTLNATPDTLSAGTEGYVLDVDKTTDAAGGGTVTIDPEYAGTLTTAGGTLSTTFQPIATSNGTAAGDVITLVPHIAISGTTPAASDYTDTLTVVGAGIF